MFSFDPDDELGLIVETARRFASAELVPRVREHESARSVLPSVAEVFQETGLDGLEIPETSGGAGLGALARVLVNEELGGADAGAALALDRIAPAVYPILEMGDDTLLDSLFSPMLEEGSRLRAVLVDASDSAMRIGETVSGRVPWVPADRVDLVMIVDRDEIIALREGFEALPVHVSGLRAAGGVELRFEEAPIIGRWRDQMACNRAMARARLHAASLLIGVMRDACEFSRQYAMERMAFGRPIAHHQGLAFLIADMASAVDGARLLVHEAAWQIDCGIGCASTAAAAASFAYAEAIEASILVGPSSVQILGGHGFMQDYPVEKSMRECRALGLMWGGLDGARDIAALSVCDDTPRFSLSRVEGIA